MKDKRDGKTLGKTNERDGKIFGKTMKRDGNNPGKVNEKQEREIGDYLDQRLKASKEQKQFSFWSPVSEDLHNDWIGVSNIEKEIIHCINLEERFLKYLLD